MERIIGMTAGEFSPSSRKHRYTGEVKSGVKVQALNPNSQIWESGILTGGTTIFHQNPAGQSVCGIMVEFRDGTSEFLLQSCIMPEA